MRILLSITLVLFISCNEKLPDKSNLVKEYYNIQVREFEDLLMEDCKDQVRMEARLKIDSLIDTWVNAELVDTLVFPSKPSKPHRPRSIINDFHRFSLDSIPD